MELSRNSFASIKPRMLRMAYGDWLAVAEAGSPLRIGACGATPEAARANFAMELEAWVSLLCDKTDREAVTGASQGT